MLSDIWDSREVSIDRSGRVVADAEIGQSGGGITPTWSSRIEPALGASLNHGDEFQSSRLPVFEDGRERQTDSWPKDYLSVQTSA